MAPSKTPLNRLNHILEEASEIEAATRDLSFETFRGSWMIRRSVEHGLLIITEAIKTLPPELKSVRQDIPWAKSSPSGIICATSTGISIQRYFGGLCVGNS